MHRNISHAKILPGRNPSRQMKKKLIIKLDYLKNFAVFSLQYDITIILSVLNRIATPSNIHRIRCHLMSCLVIDKREMVLVAYSVYG